MSLRSSVLHGLSWSVFGNFVSQGLQFVISILLARLLAPDVFGLMGMAFVVINFLKLFADLGLSSAIIYFDDTSKKFYHTVFTLNIMVGIFLSAILYWLASSISQFYSEPRLIEIVQVLSIVFFINSFSSFSFAVYKKKIKFKRISLINLTASILSGIVAIVLALRGFGVYSLVFQHLTNSIIVLIIVIIYRDVSIGFSLSLQKVKDIWSYSLNLLLSNALNFFSRNSDNVLIGKYLGSYDLGIYSRAYTLMLLPITQISNVLTAVMFPALSSIKQDIPRVKQLFLKSNRIIAFASMPLMIGMIVVADDFVLGLLGDNWGEVIPIIQILAIVGLKQPIGTTHGWIYLSQGRTDLKFKWNLFASITSIISFVIGIQFGLIGVAVAYTIRTYAIWYWGVTIPGRLVGMNFREYIINLTPTFLSAFFMGLSVYLITFLVDPIKIVLVELMIEVLLGAVIYFMITKLFKLKAYFEILELLKDRSFSGVTTK